MNKLLYQEPIQGVNYLIDKDAKIKVGDKCYVNKAFAGSNILIAHHLDMENTKEAKEDIWIFYNEDGFAAPIDKVSFDGGFEQGYKANKGVYTKEDMRKVIKDVLLNSFSINGMKYSDKETYILNLLQSLNKPKESYQVKMEDEYFDTETQQMEKLMGYQITKLKTDKEGLLIIKL